MSKSPRLPGDEDALLPLSALSHLVFCERRAALIHLEGVWVDNEHTIAGTALHQAVDEAARREEVRVALRIQRGVHLRSFALGVAGIADVVEFHADEEGVFLSGTARRWRPFPVEYKAGKPKPDDSDTVQLCAQGMALEEMLGVVVPEGALFYGKARRRLDVLLDMKLRAATRAAAARLHEIVRAGCAPPPLLAPKCRGCSLVDLCRPDVRGGASASKYLSNCIRRR